MADYKLVSTKEFLQEWRKEIRWSKNTWGPVHAKQYFNDLRDHYKKHLPNNPRLFVNPNHGLAEGYGFIRYKGHYLLFSVDEKNKQVRLEDLYGRNRFHELQNQLTQVRKGPFLEKRGYDRDNDDRDF